MPQSKSKKLSVIILNYNSGHYLSDCLQSLYQSKLPPTSWEIIVADNASTDNSFENLKNIKNKKVATHLLQNGANLGFSKGNNAALKHTNGQLILFLNPDTLVPPDTLRKILAFMEKSPQIAAATCRVVLAKTGKLQPECHRGFPTPWRALCHFGGLDRLFPTSPLFSGYFQGQLPKDKTHLIEACVGAFLLLRREAGDKISWWDEDYYWYGEDLDLCYRLAQNNLPLYFYPHCQITHYQGISSGIKSQSKGHTQANLQTKLRSSRASTEAMKTFYRKHYQNRYPHLLTAFVFLAINSLQTLRLIRARLSS